MLYESGDTLLDINSLIDNIKKSLLSITEPNFYEDERGFQGQLLIELNKYIPGILKHNVITQQEYQKKLQHHGLRIRPDIVIHKPYDPKIHKSRKDGNFVVFELKRKASAQKAVEDFNNLYSMMEILSYPIGIFININSTETQIEHLPEKRRGRIIAFSTKRTENDVIVNIERSGI